MVIGRIGIKIGKTISAQIVINRINHAFVFDQVGFKRLGIVRKGLANHRINYIVVDDGIF
ncbi:hypothetical protein D3C85_1936250 [compost metagenome]